MQALCVRCAVVGIASVGLFIASGYFGADRDSARDPLPAKAQNANPPISAASATITMAEPEARLRQRATTR